MSEETRLATVGTTDLVALSGAEKFLGRIRSEWQARPLIKRVRALLSVDPSSACQRLLNASVTDLRNKIVIAGLDIAKQAASAHGLPPVEKKEDVLQNYSTSNVLDLAYRMALLTRPEWKRLRRSYDIRRDLEHEDDDYEAGLEDLVYIFSSCIEIVLSREPTEILRVTDVKNLIESPDRVTPSPEYLADYERAPEPRQQEICLFLVSTALDPKQPDVIRQNAVEALRKLEPLTHQAVKVELGKHLQDKVKRRPFEVAEMKVAAAGGFLPYLKQLGLSAFFDGFYERLKAAGYHWKKHEDHSVILDESEDLGGLKAVPAGPRRKIVWWMVLCYVGEPGGYGFYGRNRDVIYSDSAVSRIVAMFRAAGTEIRDDVESAMTDGNVKSAMRNKHIARRYETLLDLTESA